MAQASMFKVNQLAKDLGMKNKEILTKMESSGVSVKSYMATLEPDEFNVFFDELTRENQIKDLDGYLSGKTQIRRKKAEDKARLKEARLAEQAAWQQEENEKRAQAKGDITKKKTAKTVTQSITVNTAQIILFLPAVFGLIHLLLRLPFPKAGP